MRSTMRGEYPRELHLPGIVEDRDGSQGSARTENARKQRVGFASDGMLGQPESNCLLVVAPQ